MVSESEKDVNKIAEQRVTEIERLTSQVENCQKMITDIYVSKLTTSVDNQCQVQ